MSKKPRRKHRPKKDRRVRAVPSGDLGRRQSFKVTIVTFPQPGSTGPSLVNDVALVRASILYADKVELVSPGAAMLAALDLLSSDDGSNLLALLSSLDEEVVRKMARSSDLPADWRNSLQGLNALREAPLGLLPPEFHEKISELDQGMTGALNQMKEVYNETLASSGGVELIPAFNAGILDLSNLSFPWDEGSSSDEAMNRWMKLLTSALVDPKKRLLFDDQVGDLIRAMVNEGKVEPSRIALKHASEAALGSGLIARLPTFPQAPTDELIDLRHDLRSPLSRYRSAVAKLGTKLVVRDSGVFTSRCCRRVS